MSPFQEGSIGWTNWYGSLQSLQTVYLGTIAFSCYLIISKTLGHPELMLQLGSEHHGCRWKKSITDTWQPLQINHGNLKCNNNNNKNNNVGWESWQHKKYKQNWCFFKAHFLVDQQIIFFKFSYLQLKSLFLVKCLFLKFLNCFQSSNYLVKLNSIVFIILRITSKNPYDDHMTYQWWRAVHSHYPAAPSWIFTSSWRAPMCACMFLGVCRGGGA